MRNTCRVLVIFIVLVFGAPSLLVVLSSSDSHWRIVMDVKTSPLLRLKDFGHDTTVTWCAP